MTKTTLFILLLPAFALAETTVYGQIGSGLTVSQTTSGHGKRQIGTAITDNNSHIGLRGEHALGGGNSLIWQTEQATPVRPPRDFQESLRRQPQSSSWQP